jgi:hypothetical protein
VGGRRWGWFVWGACGACVVGACGRCRLSQPPAGPPSGPGASPLGTHHAAESIEKGAPASEVQVSARLSRLFRALFLKPDDHQGFSPTTLPTT